MRPDAVAVPGVGETEATAGGAAAIVAAEAPEESKKDPGADDALIFKIDLRCIRDLMNRLKDRSSSGLQEQLAKLQSCVDRIATEPKNEAETAQELLEAINALETWRGALDEEESILLGSIQS